ncbi:hypothetical protein [Lunatibacter salilacus]|uniref:hypothetical protein n=1 Tax=Lunatibacter salilacus TaxID=2483804 RepID=UPI00131CDF00|nr:hypothetical protein [Lunatibacter salilacus]
MSISRVTWGLREKVFPYTLTIPGIESTAENIIRSIRLVQQPAPYFIKQPLLSKGILPGFYGGRLVGVIYCRDIFA